jgi:hypothetical protein
MTGMSKEESHSESQARKTRYKAGRGKLHSRTHLSNRQQPLHKRLAEKGQESDSKQQSVLTDRINWFKENWFKLIAVGALVVSIVALGLDCSHTGLQDAYTVLSVLNERIANLKEYSDSPDVGQSAAAVEDAISQAERFRDWALSAINKRDIGRSFTFMTAAGEVCDRYLPNEADIKPGTVSISAAPFQGWVSIDIPQDTTARSEDGLPVNTIIVSAGGAPPSAYKDYASVLAFEISPTGTIFSSPITLRFSYFVNNIPEGVAEEDLILGTWDAETSRWTILQSDVDLEAHTISASVSHLTLFAVLAPHPH